MLPFWAVSTYLFWQFDVAEGVADDPIAVLAALFHDAVYYHVDGGISDLQREL